METIDLKLNDSPRLRTLTALFQKEEHDLMLSNIGPWPGATVLLLTKPQRSKMVAATFMRAEVLVRRDEIVNLRLVEKDEDSYECLAAAGDRVRQRRLLIQDGYFGEDSDALVEPAKTGHRWVVVDWGDVGVSVTQVKIVRQSPRSPV